MAAKSPEAFRSISEAAAELGVAQHVLRFWESQLAFVKPLKRAGGRRFYRPRDLAVLAAVRRRRDEGRTLAEIRRLHAERRLDDPGAAGPIGVGVPPATAGRLAAYAALGAARRRLDALLGPA